MTGRRARALLLALAVLAVLAPPSSATQRDISYSVTSRGEVRADLAEFRRLVASTLDDPRGWSLGGALGFRRVATGGSFEVVLASPSVIGRVPGCSAQYSCRVGRDVLINDERWREATSSWPYTLHEYRHYVVNHEVGHWLGLGHRDCPGQGQPAPVMQQQSISLQGCRATVWPLRDERLAVARRFEVRPALPFDRPVVVRPDGRDLLWIVTDDATGPRTTRTFRWGRPTKDDVPVVGDWDGDGTATAGVARPDGRDWVWLLTDAVDAPRLDHVLRWGRPTKDDLPVVGDWDGDGRDTPGVVRPDGPDWVWLLQDRLQSPRLSTRTAWGRPTEDDVPVAGDWDGDGDDSPGVARPDGDALRWLLRDGTPELRWGAPGDTPLPGDWDGDGRDSPGVVRPEGRDLRWLWSDEAGQPAQELRWGRPAKGDVPRAGRWPL